MTVHVQTLPPRPLLPALLTGFRQRCPACGQGGLMARFLKVAEACAACGEALHHQRADDAPPYFTILIVGHLIAPLLLMVERTWHPPLALQLGLWIPLTLALTLWFLPRVKGALVGLQWALRMHGFGGHQD